MQAIALAMVQPNRRPRALFAANMVGVITYSLLEMMLEGIAFWQAPHHLLYWLYSLVMAGCAAWHAHREHPAALMAMYVMRSLALLTVYSLGEYYLGQSALDASVSQHDDFVDPTHLLMGVAVPLLGLIGGLADILWKHGMGRLKRYGQIFHPFATNSPPMR